MARSMPWESETSRPSSLRWNLHDAHACVCHGRVAPNPLLEARVAWSHRDCSCLEVQGTLCGWTMDTSPNVKVLCHRRDAEGVEAALAQVRVSPPRWCVVQGQASPPRSIGEVGHDRSVGSWKLMVSGEYAIVGDHGRPSRWRSRCGCVSPASSAERLDRELASGLEGAALSAVPVLDCAARSLGASLALGGELLVESELGAGPNKPGFGSSAAVAVAGLAALSAASDQELPSLSEAVRVHREGQGGHGSGYDVATALLGGVCLYSGATGEPRAQAAAWPEGLYAAVVFTGRGASTPKHLERLAEAGDEAALLLAELGHASEVLSEAWCRGDVLAVLKEAQRAERALSNLDERFELGIGAEGSQRPGGLSRAPGRSLGPLGQAAECLWARR